MIFEPTEQMKKDFDWFLANEFSSISRPVFRDEEEKLKAMQVWWSVECEKKGLIRRIQEFRRSFIALTGIE